VNDCRAKQIFSAKFGQPPLTVYSGRDFASKCFFGCKAFQQYINILFQGRSMSWHGSSLQSLWEFESTEQVAMRLVLGRVSLKKVSSYGREIRA